MNTIVGTLDKVTEWLDENVCEGYALKLAPHGQQTGNYPYKLVRPSVYTLYEPASDNRPPSQRPLCPCICVQLKDGAEEYQGNRQTLNLRLSMTTFDPGIHGQDWLYPYCDIATRQTRYRRGEAGSFLYSEDGWRDVWNFVDRTVRAIENAGSIAGLPIDQSTPVSFGPFTYQDETPDLYPYWLAWVDVSVQSLAIRNRNLEQYL